jgi:hypothetical protein
MANLLLLLLVSPFAGALILMALASRPRPVELSHALAAEKAQLQRSAWIAGAAGGLSALALLLISFYGFLHSTITIDDKGIKQTWVINRQVLWPDIRGAKMIGIPRAGWLSPPRLVVRTGTAFYTFNGGTEALLTEFARISLAYEMKK